MFANMPNDLTLWPHQKEALEFLIQRLNNDVGPFLVRMPTGTGKTGVIASLSLLSVGGRTLVLTPWSNLRDQMVGALKEDFWNCVGYKEKPAGKVAMMLPSDAAKVIADPSYKVIVCTFATLTNLHRSSPLLYDDLAASLEAVVVDECHYEPAIEWGRAVKGLVKPMVLLTATPYRNDLKLFRIQSNQNVFNFTHKLAERRRIIRGLGFEPLKASTDIPSLSQEFASLWNHWCSSNQFASTFPRAIVCCAGAEDIRVAVSVLNAKGIAAIGIHEQFERSTDPALVKDVPSSTNPAKVWVHQNKLTEGLDDHRFCCLVFMCDVRSDRKLVQQIGRVLRSHKSDVAKAPAVMMAPPEFELFQRWEAYREFEQDTKVMDVNHYRRIVEGLLSMQPPIEYFDGRFRKRFQTDILSTDPQVAIAPSVLIRKVQPGFSLSDYIEDCTDSLNLCDAVILGEANAPCQRSDKHALWVYASVENSNLLEKTSLYEVTLEAHCAVVAGDYLLISDTTGTFPEALLEERTVGIGAADLSSLLDKTYRVTNVATSSAVPFDTVLRASEHRGHDLNSIPASLTDRVQICRSARGAKPGARRYIGLQRGRIREELSERMRRRYSVTHFQTWAQLIGKALVAASGNHPVLQRYMQPCAAPSAPIAVSLSIDISHSGVDVVDTTGSSLEIVESSVVVSPSANGDPDLFDCLFKFLHDSSPQNQLAVHLSIQYQQSKGRFWFKSRGAADVHILETDGNDSTRKSLADFLNQNQDLILIGLTGGSYVYQGRSFYAVDYSHAEKSLFDQIVRPKIAACSNEKGTESELEAAKMNGSKAKEFIEGSLFKRIADKELKLDFDPELVICDDLGSECADFIYASFGQKAIALVHAKAGSGKGVSASAFHDVVAQAMKNLVYLTRAKEIPDGANSWTRKTYWNKTEISRLYRSPSGIGEGKKLWEKLRNDIIMSANANLHVVLATTGCCDIKQLRDAVTDPTKRTAETAQLIHMLDGLIGYARQLGVRVTIFDVPFKKPSPTKKAVQAKKAN